MMESALGQQFTIYPYVVHTAATVNPQDCVMQVIGWEVVALLKFWNVTALMGSDRLQGKLVPEE